MKRVVAILKWTGIVLVLLVAGLFIVVQSRQHVTFDAPYPDLKASTDSQVLQRGEYLVYGTAHCADCHAPNDQWAAVQKGEKVPLSGGRLFVLPIGKLYSPNLCSDKETGIGNYTDAQLARALRYGVGHDGRALFNFMPFANASEEDVVAIISYLRTMPAIKNQVKPSELNAIGKVMKAFFIRPVGPSEEIISSITPDSSVAYGRYLANNIANCRGCHTARDLRTGAFIGPDFAGGMHFSDDPGLKGEFWTPNITPDAETSIMASWSEESFIKRIRTGRVYETSPMPWGPLLNLSDTDLKAIYRYLRTLPPVHNKIETVYQPEKSTS